MKVIKNGRSYNFCINIKSHEVTVASLIPWIIGQGKYTLYLYYYGGENSLSHTVDVWVKENETHSEFLKRVEKIALKKMYILGTSILEGVGVVDDEMEKIC